MRLGLAALTFAAASASLAHSAGAQTTDAAPTVGRAEGLAAWERIHEVVSHPRCANCHVGPSDRPMWSGPSYGAARPHGMNVRAGESRIGAETLVCATCHTTRQIDAPRHPPAVEGYWRLPPIEAHWYGQTEAAICAQLSNPALTGGRDAVGIADHIGHDAVLQWAFNPGGGREPAPYSWEAHAEDVLTWGAAGTPCPE